MSESVAAKSFYLDSFGTKIRRDATEILALTLVFIFLVWYAQYHWRRRRLYSMAAKFDGPFAWPFIGNAYDFSGDTRGTTWRDRDLRAINFTGNFSDILNSAVSMMTSYKSPVRVWMGTRLFLTVTKPEEFEVVLNSPRSLEKEELYKFAEVLVGTGLFTASGKP